MADNPTVNGVVVRGDDVGGAIHQGVKMEYGADGTVVEVSATNPLPVTTGKIAGHGRKAVTTAGTDLALSTSTACSLVLVQAFVGNTQPVTIGVTGVEGATSTRTGIFLQPGETLPVPCSNLTDVFVDSLVNGEGVSYIYFS